MPIPVSISAFRERPWIALIPAAILHLVVTLCVFGVGRLGVAPNHFHPDGVGEFARDSGNFKIAASRLADMLQQGQIGSWVASNESLHLKAYSLSLLPAEFLIGNNVLAVEPVNLLYYLVVLTLTFGLGKLVAGDRAAWLAALIIALWPSLLLHTTQFLRDPLVLTSFLALITVLVLVLKEKLNWTYAAIAAIAGAGSIYVVLRVRPAIFLVLISVLLLSALLLLVKIAYLRELFVANLLVITILIVVAVTTPAPAAIPRVRTQPTVVRPPSFSSSFSIWAPIAAARYNFITDGRNVSGSLIDADVMFKSGTDIVRYIPRALEIGLLAPFPSMWFQAGQNVGLLGRLLSGIEMILTYLLVIFAGIFLWRNRKHFSSWLLVLTTIIGMLALGLVVANVGTLYRMRYPFWVPLVIMGAAGVVEAWLGKPQRREVHMPFIQADVTQANASL